jgi:hypothetical protein
MEPVTTAALITAGVGAAGQGDKHAGGTNRKQVARGVYPHLHAVQGAAR